MIANTCKYNNIVQIGPRTAERINRIIPNYECMMVKIYLKAREDRKSWLREGISLSTGIFIEL